MTTLPPPPPLYAAASAGAWRGIVSSQGNRWRVAGDRFGRLAFAPDRAAFVAPVNGRTLVVRTLGGGSRTIPTAAQTAGPVFGYGGRIAYASGSTIRVVGGATVRTSLHAGARIVELDMARDGKGFAVTGEWGDGRTNTLASALYVVRAGTTRLVARGFDPFGERPGAVFSPDGTKLAFTRGGDVWIVGVDGRGARRITRTRASEATPRWSPDGTRLAYTTGRHGVNEVYVATLDGRERRLTHTAPHPAGVPQTGSLLGAWSPDGSEIAVITYNTLGVVPASGGDERVVATLSPERSTYLGPVGWPSSS